MNTSEYLQQLAEDLELDDDELMEFIEENFGDDPEPLNPSSYYFSFDDGCVLIYPKVLFDTTGSHSEYCLFPVEEICSNLNLEPDSDSIYTWDPEEFSEEEISESLFDAGLFQMEM